MTADQRLDDYLDRLLAAMHGRPADVRRVLAEAEAHLSEAVEDGLAAGLDEDEAVTEALRRFGSPTAVARRFTADGVLPPLPVWRDLARSLTLLAAVGLVAIGVSGLLAMGMRAAFGNRFVAGDTSGVTYTPARCADFERFHPEAGSCEAAASAHHADEVEEYRVATGVLGLLVLGGWWLARRRRTDGVGVLPAGFVATVGATLFGVAGLGLLVQGLASWGAGSGQWLSGGIVSSAVAAAFAWELLGTLRSGHDVVTVATS